MAVNWADLASIAVLVTAGCAVSYAVLQRTMRQAVLNGNRRRNANWASLPRRQGSGSSRGRTQPASGVAAGGRSGIEVKAAAAAAKEAVAPEDREVTPEMLVVIAAAVTAFLGKKVRIRSAKMLAVALRSCQSMVSAGAGARSSLASSATDED